MDVSNIRIGVTEERDRKRGTGGGEKWDRSDWGQVSR